MKKRRLLIGLILTTATGLSMARPMAGAPQCTPQNKQAQQKDSHKDDKPKRLPAEVSALIDEARSAPPEFAADALIRVATSNLIADARRKRELLEEAFRVAANAQQPVKREYIGGNVDTREGYLSYAMDMKLDALSLRSRAVKAMLSVDKRKARELFSEILSKLPLEPISCDDALVYNVSDFYAVLGEVVNNSFDPAEKRREEHVRFLEPYVSGIASPAQVPHVADVLLSLDATPSQFDLLTLEFGNALKNVSEDDRSFSTAVWRDSVIQRLEALIEGNEKRGLPKQSLMAALRTYLVRNLTARRCEDNVREDKQKLLHNYVNYFNKNLSEKTISANEIKPGGVEGRYKTYRYWRTTGARKLFADVKALRFSSGTTQYSAAEKLNPDWQQRLSKFINELNDWLGEDEEIRADYFHQKSVLYEALTDILPTGPTRDGVLSDYLSFLRDSGLKPESRIEWFLHVKPLVNYARKAQGDARSKILDALRNSDDPVLRLYADIETLIPSSKQDSH